MSINAAEIVPQAPPPYLDFQTSPCEKLGARPVHSPDVFICVGSSVPCAGNSAAHMDGSAAWRFARSATAVTIWYATCVLYEGLSMMVIDERQKFREKRRHPLAHHHMSRVRLAWRDAPPRHPRFAGLFLQELPARVATRPRRGTTATGVQIARGSANACGAQQAAQVLTCGRRNLRASGCDAVLGVPKGS